MHGVGQDLGQAGMDGVHVRVRVLGSERDGPRLDVHGEQGVQPPGPNASTILTMCTSAMRTVEGLRVP
jgi:hypothetical protein